MNMWCLYIYVLLIISCSDKQKPKQENRNDLEPSKVGQTIKKWKLDSIKTYRFDETEWKIDELSTITYRDNREVIGGITFSKKEDKRNSYNKISMEVEFQSIKTFHSFNPSELLIGGDKWNQKEGIAFATFTDRNLSGKNQYRYNSNHDEWILYSSMIDSFDINGNLLLRKWYRNTDPGNYPEQNSQEIYKYKNDFLIETVSYSLNNSTKEYVKKTKNNYKGQKLVVQEEYFFDKDRNDWKLVRSNTNDFDELTRTETNISLEYENDKVYKRYKDITVFDDSSNKIKAISYEGGDLEHDYRLRLITTWEYKEDLLLEKRNYNSIESDNYSATIYSYDSKRRLEKTKRVMQEEGEKRVLNQESYIYYNQDTLIESYLKLNYKGDTTKYVDLGSDSLGNPIQRLVTNNNSTLN